MKIPEILKVVTRKKIRYAMFRLRDNNLSDLSEDHRAVLKAVQLYYPEQEGFDSWTNFNKTWDIGTDEPNILDNWEDPARMGVWWTWGISKFILVRKVGKTVARNDEEGITKVFPNPMEFFSALGYAETRGPSYRLFIKKFLDDVPERQNWSGIIKTNFSLKNNQKWHEHYRSPLNNYSEYREN